jgi:hypothetical protein
MQEQPELKSQVVAVALDRDAYDIAAAAAKAAGTSRKRWVSNAIRIAAAIAPICVECKPKKETR